MRNRALHDALRTSRSRPPRCSRTSCGPAPRSRSSVDEEPGRRRACTATAPLTTRVHRRALGSAARAAGLRTGCRGARRGRARPTCGERPARRALRARAAGDARAALRGRHRLRVPGGALRAGLRRGGAALSRNPARIAWSHRCPARLERDARGSRRRPASCAGDKVDGRPEAVWSVRASAAARPRALRAAARHRGRRAAPRQGGARPLPRCSPRCAVQARRRGVRAVRLGARRTRAPGSASDGRTARARRSWTLEAVTSRRPRRARRSCWRAAPPARSPGR